MTDTIRFIPRAGNRWSGPLGWLAYSDFGDGAPQHTPAMLEALSGHADLRLRIKALTYVGQRRWDIHLLNGIVINLPEDDPAAALERLESAEADSRILEKDISIIDLRLPRPNGYYSNARRASAGPPTQRRNLTRMDTPPNRVSLRDRRKAGKNGLVGVVDVGSSKVCCVIAKPEAGGNLKVVGYGHQASFGVRAGSIANMDAAESAIGAAVQNAEAMAGETRIAAALQKLPEQCRVIFTMSRFDELKYAEIAAELNLSVKTVENQIGKALKIMREQLHDCLPILFLLMLDNLIR